MTDTTAPSGASNTIIPTPPRLTGNQQADSQALEDWMWSLYEIFTQQAGPLNPNSQTTPQTWDPNNLPQVTNTNLATAQQTANLAWKFATAINKFLGNPVEPPTP